MSIFDERKAIEQAIQDLKEQTRMDYDLYLESRKVRNEQISVLLDRLRELDVRDRDILANESIEKLHSNKAPDTTEDWKKRKEERLREQEKIEDAEKERKLEEKRKIVSENIKKVNTKTFTAKSRKVKFERIVNLVVDYLYEKDGEVPLHEIKKYVENETGASWTNFGEVVRRLMDSHSKVRKGSKRGYYYLEKELTKND